MAKSKIQIALIQTPEPDMFNSGWCKVKKKNVGKKKRFQIFDVINLCEKKKIPLENKCDSTCDNLHSLVSSYPDVWDKRTPLQPLLSPLNFSGLLCVRGRRAWNLSPLRKTSRTNQRARSETLNHSHRGGGGTSGVQNVEQYEGVNQSFNSLLCLTCLHRKYQLT